MHSPYMLPDRVLVVVLHIYGLGGSEFQKKSRCESSRSFFQPQLNIYPVIPNACTPFHRSIHGHFSVE